MQKMNIINGNLGCGCGCAEHAEAPAHYGCGCCCCCQGSSGTTGPTGPTGATGPAGPTGATGPTEPFRSSYFEALGNGQTIPRGSAVVFDVDLADSVGDNIVLDPTGTVFTINRTGLYLVEWDVNLSENSTGAVLGILENGQPSSGASSVTAGNLSSGTLIYVDTVPFTLALLNYAGEIQIYNPTQYENSAASIRIIRFADAPM